MRVVIVVVLLLLLLVFVVVLVVVVVLGTILKFLQFLPSEGAKGNIR